MREWFRRWKQGYYWAWGAWGGCVYIMFGFGLWSLVWYNVPGKGWTFEKLEWNID